MVSKTHMAAGMDSSNILPDIRELNRRVCNNLWNVLGASSPYVGGVSPKLILPYKRNGDIRISEQEARVLYCSALNLSNYFYSIETPTDNIYQQKGRTPVSALTDLSLYVNRDTGFRKVVNIEFKAHNPALENIRKDIEKLIKEEIIGNWFHTLKNVNQGTFRNLFEKFIEAFRLCKDMGGGKIRILFCFCVLEKKWACVKEFHFDPEHHTFEDYVEKFFEMEYHINNGQIIIERKDSQDWMVFQQ